MEEIRNRFLNFAETECKDKSPLYYQLSKQIADDEQLLEIASFAKMGQPIANIFLASIHYLLLKNSDTILSNYYPSINKNATASFPFPIFKKFCTDNDKAIKEIISSRIVQTNVINRCAYLMPIFSKIITDENRPTVIIDIGTSAGLTLNFDQYEYWYNNKKVYGKSGVIVKSNIIQSVIPEIHPITQPLVKIGIDQHIINPTDADEMLWLKALIWPDQLERFIAMDEALKLPELNSINFTVASNISDFEKVILSINKSHNLIIYATHVLYQFSVDAREEFYKMLGRVGQERDFYFLSAEGIKNLLQKYNSKEVVVELTHFKNKQKTEVFVAETDGHGNWIQWK
ncbi:MAG TPA: hypothetical protein DCQ50_08215 [Chryseobacterium sp.]|nr:hypothetical protein [Chryseobacterium sp.]